MYRIHQIKLRLGEGVDALPQKILKKIGRTDLIIKDWKIVRESIDARDKSNICLVYSVDFVAVYKKNPAKQARLASNGKLRLEIAPDESYRLPEPGSAAAACRTEDAEGGRPCVTLSGCETHGGRSTGAAEAAAATEAEKAAASGASAHGAAPRLGSRPVVVGFGPAGMLCALTLAQAGYRPIVLERGQSVDERCESVRRFWEEGKLNPQSNIQFGEGGAGTFSDGKLTTGTKDIRIGKVLAEFVAAGAPEDILYKQKPHVGTDILRIVVKNIREEIIAHGGEVRFNSQVSDIVFADEGVGAAAAPLACGDSGASGEPGCGTQASEAAAWRQPAAGGLGAGCPAAAPQPAASTMADLPQQAGLSPKTDPPQQAGPPAVGRRLAALQVTELGPSGEPLGEYRLETEAAVFALGHSARDTFRMLRSRGVYMEQKPFSIGVRIEHPQELIDRAQYGRPAGELGLPPADYKINHRCENGRGVYTFCMCPGGEVIVASSQEGGVVTNGMSYRDRASGTANSALLCDVRTSDFGSDDVLAGVEFQEKYEHLAFVNGGGNYKPPKSTWGELRDGKAPAVEGSLPQFATEAFREAMPYLGRKIKDFDADSAVVTAVETRSSSPVRIKRDDSLQGQILCGGAQAGTNLATASGATQATSAQAASSPAAATQVGTAFATAGSATSGAANQAAVQFAGFYPCGEGAGYAGGITSAAVDGIKVAEAIIARFLPLSEKS